MADRIDSAILRDAVCLRSDGVAHATIALCDEVDRLRAENERLQQALDGIGTALGCAQNGVITQQEAWRQIEENLRAVHPDGPGLAAGYAVVNRSELDALRQQVADRDRQITALMEAARP